jgi:GTP cyclohydrolase III
MPNGVDALVQSVQSPCLHSTVSSFSADSEIFELFERYDPMLAIRDLSNLPVPSRHNPPPMGR